MSKRTRLGKRLEAISEELAEHQLVEEIENTLGKAADDALFVVDKPGNKKRAKVQRKQPARTGTDASSNKDLVASAAELTQRVSRAKYLQPEVVEENEPSKSQQKLVKRRIAALERRKKTLQIEKEKKEKAGAPRDIWSEEETKESALSAFPKRVKTPGSISMSAELFLTKKRDVPKVVVGLTSGNSYNPSVEAHQEAIAILTKAEEKALSERKALQDELDHNLYKRSIADTIDSHEKKLLEGASAADTAVSSDSETASSSPESESDDEPDDNATAADAPKLTRKERKKLNRARRKAALREQEDVEAAVALAEKKAVERRERRERRIREGEEKEEADFLHKTFAYAPVLPVPLSNELSGSLRTMKPVSNTELILDSMTNLVGTGQVHKRMSASGVIVDDADDAGNMEVTVLSEAAQRAYKKIGKPYRMVEFPRRKGFVPAEQGAIEEQKKLALVNQ